MNKTCIILRGLPGSGKSSLAAYLDFSSTGDSRIVSADDYFVGKDGKYNFDIGKLGEAHEWCFEQFKKHIDYPVECVIVDNTNCKPSEFQRYKEYAEANGYYVVVLLVENHHGNKSIHDVPEQTLVRREKLLRDSIKLR